MYTGENRYISIDCSIKVLQSTFPLGCPIHHHHFMNQLTTVKKRLLEQKKSLFQKYQIKELAIFGSYARNEQNPSSDLDLLVEFHSSVGSEFIELGDELEELLGIKVDLVSKKGIKPRYLEVIKKELVYI